MDAGPYSAYAGPRKDIFSRAPSCPVQIDKWDRHGPRMCGSGQIVSFVEKETRAIAAALQKWRHLLPYHLKLITDHRYVDFIS
ncbi:hypothetical protein J6590_013211 [Homalodisca vitripennis]|nr:hypothetical protein J6590_013211 [Homalodisca vitripennis]